MKAYIRSAVRVCSWSLAAAVVLLVGQAAMCDEPASATMPATTPEASPATTPANQPATAPATQPAAPLTADELPPAASFKVKDTPSDDGSGIIVQWGKPAKERAGIKYVVEFAASPEEFALDNAQSVEVDPAKANSLAWSNHEVFGYGQENKNIYYLEEGPGDLGGPPGAELTLADLRKAMADKLVSPAEYERAKAILAVLYVLNPPPKPVSQPATAPAEERLPTVPAGYVPTLHDEQEIRWVHRLRTYLSSADDFKKSLQAKTISDAEYKRALAALRTELEKNENQLSVAERVESEWLGRLRTCLTWIETCGKLSKLLSQEVISRAQAALKIEFAAAGKFTDKEKTELEWLKTFRSYPQWFGKFKGCVAQKTLTEAQFKRAKHAMDVELAKAEGDRTDEERSEITWVKRLKAYKGKQGQDEQKVQAREDNKTPMFFRLAVQQGDQKTYVMQDGKPAIRTATASPDWFKWFKLNNLIFSLIFCGIVFAFIQIAKRRPGLFIRKIGGLEAMDEAIGRSTEMNRPVFFVHGLGDMSDIATIASVNILGRVAERTAQYDSRVRVMNSDPIVTAVSQEVVQQGYMQAGRPDAFNADDVSLVATDQFSYVAAVSGRMVREQPGAIFLLGSFAAESLLLAETGASTGAIQVAGTDAFTQLPFFITTCDYTLIGEELYAASAYLSREPRLLGSLRGQDVGKAFLMVVLVVVPIILTIAAAKGWDFGWLHGFLSGGKG